MKRLSIAGLAAVLVLPAAPAMADAEFRSKVESGVSMVTMAMDLRARPLTLASR